MRFWIEMLPKPFCRLDWCLCAFLLICFTAHAQAPRLPQPKFKIDIHADAEGGPRFTVTNSRTKP
jgi:hypothetical protein